MYRLSPKLHTALVLLLVSMTGCHPTQPFYLKEDGDLSHYLEKSQQVEHADVKDAHLAEVEQSRAPITLSSPEFNELWDLTLQECVHISLANTKVIRGGSFSSPRIQQGQIFAGTQEGSLTDQTTSFETVFNPAIRESGIGSIGSNSIGDGQQGVESALAAFDTQARVIGSQGNNALFSKTDRPQNINPTTGATGFPQQLNLDNGGLISSLTKRAATGTTYTATNQTDYTSGNQRGAFQGVTSFWTTTLEMRVDQPLLRGRGEQVNRAPVVIARIGTDTELASLEDQLQKMVCNIEIRYWDLHRSYRDLEAAKIGRDTTLTTWRTVYERYRQGVESTQSEAQSREQYFQFRASVEQALRDLHNNENELRLLMGLSVSDGRLIRPIDEPSLARVQFDWNQVLAESLVKRPEIRQRRWEIKRREMELIIARNQLLPQLDVGALYRYVGIGDQLVTANPRDLPAFSFDAQGRPVKGSTAVENLFDGKSQEFGFFVTGNMTIGFRREMAGVRTAQLALAREKAYLEDVELDISHSLARGLRNMDANYTLAQTHYNRMSAAEKEVEAAQAAYEVSIGQGRQPLDQLLDATRRRSSALQAYYQSICEYNKSIADVHTRKGSILEYCGVEFEEGPWAKKAYWDALSRARERDAGTYIDYGYTRPRVINQGTNDSAGIPPLVDGVTEEDRARANSTESTPAELDNETPHERMPNILGPEAKAAPANSDNRLRTTAAPVGEANRANMVWGEQGLASKNAVAKGSNIQLASHYTNANERSSSAESVGQNYSPARNAPRR